MHDTAAFSSCMSENGRRGTEFTPPQGSARDGRRVFPDPRCGFCFWILDSLVCAIQFVDLVGLGANILLIVWWALHSEFPCLSRELDERIGGSC